MRWWKPADNGRLANDSPDGGGFDTDPDDDDAVEPSDRKRGMKRDAVQAGVGVGADDEGDDDDDDDGDDSRVPNETETGASSSSAVYRHPPVSTAAGVASPPPVLDGARASVPASSSSGGGGRSVDGGAAGSGLPSTSPTSPSEDLDGDGDLDGSGNADARRRSSRSRKLVSPAGVGEGVAASPVAVDTRRERPLGRLGGSGNAQRSVCPILVGPVAWVAVAGPPYVSMAPVLAC